MVSKPGVSSELDRPPCNRYVIDRRGACPRCANFPDCECESKRPWRLSWGERFVSERGGLHRSLEFAGVYTLFQRIISRSGAAAAFRAELYPELGSGPLRVLDIGCGPAAFWARYNHIEGIAYVGIEPNRAYVEEARARFPGIELHAGTVAEARHAVAGVFDLIVLEGVLHHIDDETAREALQFAAEKLGPAGRLVMLDTVLLPRQNPIARLLARFDRGKHVRSLRGYQDLATSVFATEHVASRHLRGRLRIPYDYSVLVCSRS